MVEGRGGGGERIFTSRQRRSPSVERTRLAKKALCKRAARCLIDQLDVESKLKVEMGERIRRESGREDGKKEGRKEGD